MKHMWSEEEIQGLISEQGGSGGGKLYLHIISIAYPEVGGFCINIKTNTNTPFTCETLISYLKALGYTSRSQTMPCAPYRVGTDAAEHKNMAVGVFCDNSIYLGVSQATISNGDLYILNGNTTKDYPSFTDTVTDVL